MKSLLVLLIVASPFVTLSTGKPTTKNDLSPRFEAFEAHEHELIGNDVILKYTGANGRGINNVMGKQFDYKVSSRTPVTGTENGLQSLSYGQVVALAGDFFGNWDTDARHDVPQISDDWVKNKGTNIAADNAGKLRNNTGGYLDWILGTMSDQWNEVQKYNDTAQGYHNNGFLNRIYSKLLEDMSDWRYATGTILAIAYSALHTLALRKALEARNGDPSAANNIMKEAYFFEAFGQHFLTDLFSAGHLRTPRRLLHGYFSDDSGVFPTIVSAIKAVPDVFEQPEKVWPADGCGKKMHDEDSANGLWVSNRLGESWATYGDGQLVPRGKNAENYRRAVEAAQFGVDEVWQTRQDGVQVVPKNFAALRKVPYAHMDSHSNFVPLFRMKVSEDGVLLFRSNQTNRANLNISSPLTTSKMKKNDWRNIITSIEPSPQNTNMFPYSQPFLSNTSILHVRQSEPPNSRMVFNRYGPVNSGKYGSWWNMKSQKMLPAPWVTTQMRWVKADMLPNGILSLVGRQNIPPGHSKVLHIGLQLDSKGVSWEKRWDSTSSEIYAPGLVEGNVVYGQFTSNSNGVTMIKYLGNTAGDARLELWSVPVDQPAPIVSWKTSPFNFIFPYRDTYTNDPFDTLIGYKFNKGQGQTPSYTTWNFTTWPNGYSQNPSSIVYREDTGNNRAQVLFPGKLTTRNPNYLLRISYSDTSYDANIYNVRIEVLEPTRRDGKIQSIARRGTSSFSMKKNDLPQNNYLTWFLADVNGDPTMDLVALNAPDSRPDLRVVIFPGQRPNRATGTQFGAPVISNITLGANVKGELFNAAFMKPLFASQANYTDSKTNRVSSAGILAFFDNYDILGVRMLAPVSLTGTYQYELKGQTPAIAGQISQGLGTFDGGRVMGRSEPPQRLGFFVDKF